MVEPVDSLEGPARSSRLVPWLIGLTVAALFFVLGLALTRITYELAFPALLWLARPFPVILIAGLTAIGGRLLWGHWELGWPTAVPLLLNLVYLFDPSVNLVQSRLLFAASLWLVALMVARERLPVARWRWAGAGFVIAALLPVYLLTMPHAVGRADTFEFQVVVPQLGIVHPTGYPLYLLLGKLATLLNPFGSPAWRLNLATAVFGLAAAVVVFRAAADLTRRPAAAVLGAVALGLTPTFWSQAIEAEVYTLHALLVALALWLMVRIAAMPPDMARLQRGFLALAFLIGLGLTNHLTSLFLIPPAALTFLLVYLPAARLQARTAKPSGARLPLARLPFLLALAASFAAPLLLYAYLPLRWAAVNGEPMGMARFVDWVIGGRFQGALQPLAWLRDPTRWQVVGRLLRDNWGWTGLALSAAGALLLFWRSGRAALVLLAAWLGFVFYALNYYVPDLAVFLMAAHVVMAIWLGVALAAVEALGDRLPRTWDSGRSHTTTAVSHTASSARRGLIVADLLLLALFTPVLLNAVDTWYRVDRAAADGGTAWATAVLALPLAENGAILADSEKIAPLYYLQQAEGVRPDLDIMVLPDEAAYRAELDARVAAGQAVYLARFLPGLQAEYHLNSVGPLIEVSRAGRTALPADAVTADLAFGDLTLAGYAVDSPAAEDGASTGVTLYWRAAAPTAVPQFVYVRWAGAAPDNPAGQHPAANYYPTSDWEAGEIVADYHLLPQPVAPDVQRLELQVALGPPFAGPDALVWQTVTRVDAPPAVQVTAATPLRAQVGATLLSGTTFAAQSRPQTTLPVLLTGYGAPAALELFLRPAGTAVPDPSLIVATQLSTEPFSMLVDVETAVEPGDYELVAGAVADAACGWLQPPTADCVLGSVAISGVALPEGAVNFDDQIALLDIELASTTLQPGGELPLTLTWQSLGPVAEDYTIFIQVLDAADRIVGQVDAWPLQGTYPTSQWTPGEVVVDPHIVQLSGELAPGTYRVQVGWYLLATLRRLPVLDADGTAVDDKVVVTGLTAGE